MDYFPLINNFDHNYYIQNNDDLKSFKNLNDSYKHWYKHGCHEGRPFKTIDGKIYKIKFPNNFKKPTFKNITINNNNTILLNNNQKFNMKRQFAIMLYIFNHKLINFYITILNNFMKSYTNFDIFIAIVDHNDYSKNLFNKFINNNNINKINNNEDKDINNNNYDNYHNFNNYDNVNLNIFDIQNKGGDIGGLLFLTKKLFEHYNFNNDNIPYKFVTFAHTKTNTQWRIKLCNAVFNYDYKKLFNEINNSNNTNNSNNSSNYYNNIGMIGSKSWNYTFKDNTKTFYQYHLNTLRNYYKINFNNDKKYESWNFIAGTILTMNIKIISHIYNNNINEVYDKMNVDNSIDIAWIDAIKFKKLKNKDCFNDLYYRKNYGKSILSDFMIEHTFERIIGLISKHYKLQTITL